jgi:hypothetical protein
MIILKALNIESGELTTKNIPVLIIPPIKKPRKKKVSTKKVTSKPIKWNIKLNNSSESDISSD